MKKAVIGIVALLALAGCSGTPSESAVGFNQEAFCELVNTDTDETNFALAIEQLQKVRAVAPEDMYADIDVFISYFELLQEAGDDTDKQAELTPQYEELIEKMQTASENLNTRTSELCGEPTSTETPAE
ncbi:MAG: membrane lipoprotein lipid attachment site-containing protein [Propionibacteriaceae bacterium]|nr:membrane lipoprotein lipid attachment site-containing protein [Propionibacteriaceae bacterium]